MEHHESQVQLPRSLQDLKPTKTIEKIMEPNFKLKENDWSTVTAGMSGTALDLITFGKSGLSLLTVLQSIKVEDEKSVADPTPKKPQTQYCVDLLVPRDWEAHTVILEPAFRLFSTAKNFKNPNRDMPLGSKRTLHILFSTVLAPYEVLTVDDLWLPIREVMLDNGTGAQVIHKWNRRNDHPMPSRFANWKPRQTFAAVTQELMVGPQDAV